MGRARYNTGLFPLPDNVLPVQLFGGTSEGGVSRPSIATSNQNNHLKPTDTSSSIRYIHSSGHNLYQQVTDIYHYNGL